MMNENDKYIGMTLDERYKIEELIGNGGMANVYKALSLRLNRYDAVKIMHADLLENEDFRRRFQTESQAVAMLSHPNIVSVYDVSHTDDIEYIVMELVDGITLKQYMKKRGALEYEEALDFSIQIAGALEHAHSKGIIHRDIKPQNIMLLKDGQLKVADFGIASLESDVEIPTDEAVGSVHYIAPEQARGMSADARSDVYSLGIVMYEMLTGKLPYEGESEVEVAVMHMNAEPVTPRSIIEDIPEELENIVLKAMETEADDRYQSAAELLNDLTEFRKLDMAARVKAEADSELQSEEADRLAEDKITEEYYDKAELDEKRRKKKKQSRRVAFGTGLFGVLVFIVLVFIFINTYFLKDIFGEAERIEVDNFVGRYYEDVVNDSDYAKIYDFTVTFKVDKENEYGKIIDQTPEAGRSKAVENGKIEVELIISSGEQMDEDDKIMREVPEVTNYDRNQAVSALQAAGFKYVLEEESSDEVTEGYVIYSEPAAGEKAKEGTSVKLYISTGPQVEMVTMPVLKGLSKDAAIAKIESSDLSVGSVTTVESELDAGTVVGQSVDSGTEIEAHTKINIQISGGPQSDDEG